MGRQLAQARFRTALSKSFAALPPSGTMFGFSNECYSHVGEIVPNGLSPPLARPARNPPASGSAIHTRPIQATGRTLVDDSSIDRILNETESSFTSTDGQPLGPADSKAAVDAITCVRNTSPDVIANATRTNP